MGHHEGGRELRGNENTSWVMPTHIVAAAGVVENENGEILLVRTYNGGGVFPGGQVEEGENVVEAAQREIFEESGIRAKVEKLFCISSNTCKYPGYNGVKEIPTKVMLDFICRKTGGNLRGSDETAEAAWLKPDEALARIQAPAIRERFRVYLEWKEQAAQVGFGTPTYLEYVTKPEFKLKQKRTL